MREKKIVKMILLILLIFFIILLFLIMKMHFIINKNSNDSYIEITEENLILEDVAPYISDLEFETINIPKKILKYIDNKEEFDIAIKKFLYRKGLIDASKGTLEKYEINLENEYIQMYFKLNNQEEKVIVVILGYNENLIEILDFYGYDGE